jgi:tetratricopeptide (TPR) repeat protein
MAYHLYFIGHLKCDLHLYNKSLPYFQRALEFANTTEHEELRGNIYNDMGTVYSQCGEYEKAIESYSYALPLREKLNDIGGQGNVLLNIGTLLMKGRNLDKAIDYLSQAIDKLIQAGDEVSLATALLRSGQAYSLKGDYQEAWAKLTDVMDTGTEAMSSALKGVTQSAGTGVLLKHEYAFTGLSQCQCRRETPGTGPDDNRISIKHAIPY